MLLCMVSQLTGCACWPPTASLTLGSRGGQTTGDIPQGEGSLPVPGSPLQSLAFLHRPTFFL